jgi:RES domain-containing protein
MLHDQTLLDLLAGFTARSFRGQAYRATRQRLDPLQPSVAGGRWMMPGTEPVLYTSLERDGALAEIAYHWQQLIPPPSKPVVLHTLALSVSKTLYLTPADLRMLGVTWPDPESENILRSQAIGAAAAFLGYDSLQVPSARSDNDNLIVVFPNHDAAVADIQIISSEEVDWRMYVGELGSDE